jgi:hypothetical protein
MEEKKQPSSLNSSDGNLIPPNGIVSTAFKCGRNAEPQETAEQIPAEGAD